MPEVHYLDHVAEANRDEIRRMESLLKRLQDENLKLREENLRLLGHEADANNRLARLRNGGRA